MTAPAILEIDAGGQESISGLSIGGFAAATEPISLTLKVNHGTLTANTRLGGGVDAYQVTNNGTDLLTVRAPLAAIQVLLAAENGLIYGNTSNPKGTGALAILVGDGFGNRESAVVPISITGTMTLASEGLQHGMVAGNDLSSDSPTMPLTDEALPLNESASTVTGRMIFYNRSVFDGNDAAIDANDDNAIATDKTPLLPLDLQSTAANITSYSRGINGIMIDLSADGNHAAITASDFVFKVGNNNSLESWIDAPAPSAVVVRPGAGVGSSDRIVITWATGAIRNMWLEVKVLPNANTGLATTDVHFWGNRVADSGTSPSQNTFDTTTTDAAQVFATLGAGKPITDLRDYNRDGQVTSTDAAIVFANIGTLNKLLGTFTLTNVPGHIGPMPTGASNITNLDGN
jgi:hypothetical protein